MSAVHILMALLGLGLPGGFAGLVAKFGLNTVLGGASTYFKKVPRWVWIALAVIVALVVFTIWHQHKAHAAIAAAKAQQKIADDAAWQAAFDRERIAAGKWRQAAELNAKAISDRERMRNDETNRHIDAGAADLLLRGPGKAAAASCRPVDHAGVPAGGGQPGPGDHRPPDGAGTVLPGDDGTAQRAIVPWNWLVGRARQCDLDRAEALTWRSWYVQQASAWERMRAQAPKAATPSSGAAR